MIELHITFIPDGENCDPIQIINRIIEQLQMDFKREHLLEFDVSLGTFTPIDSNTHILIHRMKEDGKPDVQSSRVEP